MPVSDCQAFLLKPTSINAKPLIDPFLVDIGQLSIIIRSPYRFGQRVCKLQKAGFAELHCLLGAFQAYGHQRPAKVRIHQRAIENKKIHLVKELPDDLTAEVHAIEMLQVLSNLLINAIDALPDNGLLYLRLRKRQSQIHLLIADNGHGIPVEPRGEIFKPFFTTKQDRGTGLGLALAKKIINNYRGEICVRSSLRPDKSGTTFIISLPG